MIEKNPIQVTSPADLASVLPNLIGFEPEQSLVVMALAGRSAAVIARVDLADITPPGAMEDLLDRIWARFPGAEAVVVAYTPDPHLGWAAIERAEKHLGSHKVALSMLIAGDTWYARGGASGKVNQEGDVVDQAVEAGLSRLANRSELERALRWAPDTFELAWAMSVAQASVPATNGASIIAIADAMRPHLTAESVAVTQDEALRLSALLGSGQALSVAMMSITSDTAAQYAALWRQVVQASPATHAGRPLFLAGLSAWVSGDGASMAVAAAHARQVAGDHVSVESMTLERLIDNVVPPSAWTSMRADMLLDASPTARRAALDLIGEAPSWETAQARSATPDQPGNSESAPSQGIAI